ncbi:MAG: hypothetical protein ACKVZJ_02010 [Phycisphaerales bacterium]
MSPPLAQIDAMTHLPGKAGASLRRSLAASVVLHVIALLGLGAARVAWPVDAHAIALSPETADQERAEAAGPAEPPAPPARPLTPPKANPEEDRPLVRTPPPRPIEPRPESPPEPKRVQLGNDTSSSDAVTMNWIGFDEFVEHSSRNVSQVDQAAFTRDAPGPLGPPGPAAPPMPVGADAAMAVPPVRLADAPPRAQTPTPESLPTSTPSPPVTAPLVIAEEVRRPPAEPAPKLAAVEKPEVPSEAATPPEAAAKPAAPGPVQEAKEAAAPKPASLPEQVKADPRRELAAPPAPGDPGVPVLTPTPGRAGAPKSPEHAPGPEPVAAPRDVPTPAIGPEQKKIEALAPPPPPSPSTSPSPPDSPPAPPVSTPENPEPVLPAPLEDDGAALGEFSQGSKPDDAEALDPNPPRPKAPIAPTPDQSTPNQPSANTPPKPPSTPVLPGSPRSGGGGGGREGRGVLSDRESVAAAIRRAVNVDRWGQPLVAKGLTIKTVRPKFSKYTQVTSGGRGAPVIRILFLRSGKVDDVIVLSSSGNPDVDRPVVDAAFQWTAEGEALKKLAENPPETVGIDVRVIR